MADKTIAALPNDAPTNASLFEHTNAVGNSRHCTGTQLKTFAAGGSGWHFSVPAASAFTLASGDANNLTLTDDADTGIHIGGGPISSGRVYRTAFQALPNPSNAWTLDCKIDQLGPGSGLGGIGPMMRDSTTGKMMHFSMLMGNANLGFYNLTNLTTFSSAIAERALSWFNTPGMFMRLGFDLTNLTASYSINGKQFEQFGSVAKSTFFGANTVNQVGFGELSISSPNERNTGVMSRFVVVNP